MFPGQSASPLNAAVNATANAVVNVASGALNAVTTTTTDVLNNVGQATASAANAVAQNMPLFNSILPLSNNAAKPANNAAKPANNAAKPANNATKPANNSFFGNNTSANMPMNNNSYTNRNNYKNNSAAVENNSFMKNSGYSAWYVPVIVFVTLIGVSLGFILMYQDEVTQGYEFMVANIKFFFNLQTDPDVISAVKPALPEVEVTIPAAPPQDQTPKQKLLPQITKKTMVEKILPSSTNEVFNVAQNNFTYYDAEPLCKALGAELATYEQVKDAWSEGADWCNYGWVKGQMAVFPTQKETYDKLQAGPKNQRNVCGTVGINGGYFENPEFKYGVNCYGQKPSQSAHDQEMLMSEGKAPPTPDTFEVDAKIAEYKDQADSLYIKPFSDVKWSDS